MATTTTTTATTSTTTATATSATAGANTAIPPCSASRRSASIGVVARGGASGLESWLPGGASERETGVQAPVGFCDPLGPARTVTRLPFTIHVHGADARPHVHDCSLVLHHPGVLPLRGLLLPVRGLEVHRHTERLGRPFEGAGRRVVPVVLVLRLCEVYAAKQDEGFGTATYGNLGLFRADGISNSRSWSEA